MMDSESIFRDFGVLTASLYFGSSGCALALVANQPEETAVITLIKIIPALFTAMVGVLQVVYTMKIKREKLAVERELRFERLRRHLPDSD
jgi:hypothetical protein